MAYKTRYRPLEVLGPMGWSAFMPEIEDTSVVAAPVRTLQRELA
jgi:arginyl-tRNA--protein-N-Asp/Glu arginylyltransferase